MPSEKKRKGISYPKIVLSLFLLFNINIGIVDLLPDAIAFFILAGEFKYSSARAPFFSEARDAFKKLAVISLLKYPAAIIAAMSGVGGAGNDMAALFSLTFSAFETVYAIKAVGYTFDALYRLGERTSATALIQPFQVFKGSFMSCETLRFFTYLLTVVKCVFQAIPDMFRLTRVAENGFSIITSSPGYPISILVTQFFGLIVGIFWLIFTLKYVSAVKRQGEYDRGIDSLVSSVDALRLERREKINRLNSSLSLLVIATVFTLEIRFLNSSNINLVPHTVYGLFLIAVVIKLFDSADLKLRLFSLISAVGYTLATGFYYFFETRFLYYFGYKSLAGIDIIPPEYVAVEITATVEAVFYILTLVGIALMLRNLILTHTGMSLGSVGYSRSDRKYHLSLLKMSAVHLGSGIIFALTRCAVVFSQAMYTIDVLDRDDIANLTDVPNVVYIPSFEWLGTLCAVICIAYIGLTVYFTSNIKDEIKMKYSAIGDDEL